jgi:GNAT superfamily N-acetyltransferase
VAAAAPALRIEPLSERHERESFASGVAPLDRYLRQQAAQDTRRRVASCFVLITESDRVPIGYFTLAATGITLAELPEPLAKRLPRFPRVPAILMGRLAIDARHQRQGHGEFMLLDALSRALRNEIASYAFVVDANDDNAVRFYQCFGFRSLTAGTRRLFMPMTEIAKLFS